MYFRYLKYFAPLLSLLFKLNNFFSLKTKKKTKIVVNDKHYLENYRFRQKSGIDACSRGVEYHVICFIMTHWVRKSICNSPLILAKMSLLKKYLKHWLDFNFNPFCSQCTLSLPPRENIRKLCSFLMFTVGRKRIRLEQMG